MKLFSILLPMDIFTLLFPCLKKERVIQLINSPHVFVGAKGRIHIYGLHEVRFSVVNKWWRQNRVKESWLSGASLQKKSTELLTTRNDLDSEQFSVAEL